MGGACQCDATKEPSVAPCVIDDAFGVFVAPPGNGGNDTTGAGTMAAPFASLTKALASLGGKKLVFVCDGTFAEQVTVTTPVSIFGGLGCPGSAQGTAWTYVGGSAQVNSPSAAYALAVTNVPAVTIEDIRFSAADASGTDPSGDGNSSIAAVLVSSSIAMKRVTLAAGTGANGSDGLGGTAASNYTGSTAAPGVQGVGGTGSLTGGAGGTVSCANGDTSAGGAGGPASYDPAGVNSGSNRGGAGTSSPATTANGSRNGAGGYPNCIGPPNVPLYAIAGADGAAHAAGVAAAGYGALSSTGWIPSQGGSGEPGAPGQGGGGGGGDTGGPTQTYSGSGGGAGGCGGSGGGGGRGGGGSIALASLGSTVTLTVSTLTSSAGGNGGNGGGGQNGQAGGTGAPTSGPSCIAGGTGGNGAGGSGGAGGTAGISASIVFTGAQPAADSATVMSAGAGGSPGAGAGGGTGGSNSVGTAPSGNTGANGLAWMGTSVLGPL